MKSENQVSSLEPSKKLKELGVKQDSLFYWEDIWEEKIHKEPVEPRLEFIKKKKPVNKVDVYSTGGKWASSWYSAFTVAELGEMLPRTVKSIGGEILSLKMYKNSDGYNVCYMGLVEGHREFARTEADARAKMLCYLIENNLIKI